MSLFSMIELPDWYFVSLINTEFVSHYVDNFINNTSHFQINDARQLPIIIPGDEIFEKIRVIAEKSVSIKKEANSTKLSECNVKQRLSQLQRELDNLVLNLYKI